MIILDNDHIVSMDILKPHSVYYHDFNESVVQYKKQIAHGFIFQGDNGEGKMQFVCIGKNNIPFYVRSEFGKLNGFVKLPTNKTLFFNDGNDWDKSFAAMIEADLKKHNITIAQFLQRPEAINAGLRYRIFERQAIAKQARGYKESDVNYKLTDENEED